MHRRCITTPLSLLFISDTILLMTTELRRWLILWNRIALSVSSIYLKMQSTLWACIAGALRNKNTPSEPNRKSHDSLQVLSDSEGITDVCPGAIALATIFLCSDSLATTNLCAIGSSGADALARGLAENSTLTRNIVDDASRKKISDPMRSCAAHIICYGWMLSTAK